MSHPHKRGTLPPKSSSRPACCIRTTIVFIEIVTKIHKEGKHDIGISRKNMDTKNGRHFNSTFFDLKKEFGVIWDPATSHLAGRSRKQNLGWQKVGWGEMTFSSPRKQNSCPLKPSCIQSQCIHLVIATASNMYIKTWINPLILQEPVFGASNRI